MHAQAQQQLEQRLAPTDPDFEFWRSTVTDAVAHKLRHVKHEFSPEILVRMMGVVQEYITRSRALDQGNPSPTTQSLTTTTTVSGAQVLSLPPAYAVPGQQPWPYMYPPPAAPVVIQQTSATPQRSSRQGASTPLNTSFIFKDMFRGSASPSPVNTPQMPEDPQ